MWPADLTALDLAILAAVVFAAGAGMGWAIMRAGRPANAPPPAAGTWLLEPPESDEPPARPRWLDLLREPSTQRGIVRLIVAVVGLARVWMQLQELPPGLDPALAEVINALVGLFDLLFGGMIAMGVIGLRRDR